MDSYIFICTQNVCPVVLLRFNWFCILNYIVVSAVKILKISVGLEGSLFCLLPQDILCRETWCSSDSLFSLQAGSFLEHRGTSSSGRRVSAQRPLLCLLHRRKCPCCRVRQRIETRPTSRKPHLHHTYDEETSSPCFNLTLKVFSWPLNRSWPHPVLLQDSWW